MSELTTTAIGFPKEIDLDRLSAEVKSLVLYLWELFLNYHASDEDRDRFIKALIFAYRYHIDVKRKSGETYFIHDVRCAIRCLISQLGLTMATGMLLHEFIEDDGWTRRQLQEEFGKVIADMIFGLSKPKKSPRITRLQRAQRHIDIIKDQVKRKHNWRVVVGKLIDRYDNTHDIANLKQEHLDQLFSETDSLFLPMFYDLEPYVPSMYLITYCSYCFEVQNAVYNYYHLLPASAVSA